MRKCSRCHHEKEETEYPQSPHGKPARICNVCREKMNARLYPKFMDGFIDDRLLNECWRVL